MLKALTDLLERSLGRERMPSEQDREHGLRLATATLLVEVVRADYEVSEQETQAVEELLGEFFALPADEAGVLVEEAQAQADHAASLQDFTRQLHECLSVEDKHAIVTMLWRAALADKRLDKHEDHLIRKVAGLLYVSHSDLIRLRNEVRAPSL